MNAIKFSDIINRIRSEIITQVSEGHFEDEMSYSRFERYSRDLPLFKLNSKYRNKPEYFSVLHTPNENGNYETLTLKPREKQNWKFFIVDDWKDFKIPDPEQDACYRLYKSRSNPTKPLFSHHTFLRAL